MRRIDAFAHILPRRYVERLERHLESSIPSAQLSYYREGVFHFDSSISDLAARRRKLEPFADYAQVLVLAVPPLEEVGPAAIAAEFARLANDEMAALVAGHSDRFAGFVAALPLNDVDASLLEIDRAVEELHALGVQMFTNVRGLPLDDARFERSSRGSRHSTARCGCIRHGTEHRPTIDRRRSRTLACGGRSVGPTRRLSHCRDSCTQG